MNQRWIHDIADEILRAEGNRIQVQGPTAYKADLSREEAYKIQDEVFQGYLKQGFHSGGYKIGCTLYKGWAAIGVDQPFYGPMFRERIYEGIETVFFDHFIEPRLEAEIAFIFAKGVTEPANEDIILEAAAYITPAIEIIDSRVRPEGRKLMDIIADAGTFGACVLGKNRFDPKAASMDRETAEIIVNGVPFIAGAFADVMGSPLKSMIWLADRLREEGRPLRKGDVVISGSCIDPLPVKKGDSVQIHYSTLEMVKLTFI